MGNAGQKARAVSADVMSTNDKDGVAEAIQKYVLDPRSTSVAEYSAKRVLSTPWQEPLGDLHTTLENQMVPGKPGRKRKH